jgi:hypothetical protein
VMDERLYIVLTIQSCHLDMGSGWSIDFLMRILGAQHFLAIKMVEISLEPVVK